MSWIPDLLDLYLYGILKHMRKRKEAGMEEANQDMVVNAIEIFKDRYGIKEPLDLFRMDSILIELKQKQKETKRKGRKK